MGVEKLAEFLDMSAIGVEIALASSLLAPVVYPLVFTADDYILAKTLRQKISLKEILQVYAEHFTSCLKNY